MAHLIIKEVGPIREVEFDINRINVFIGPQSSGKSTITKIMSFCLWIEKTVCLFREYSDKAAQFRRLLEEYHNMQGYISEKSYIRYTSRYVEIRYEGGHAFVLPVDKEVDALAYRRSKIIYIPAERNLVSLPKWTTFKLPANNLQDFTSDWGFMREFFSKDFLLPVTPLGIYYYYDKTNRTDYVTVKDSDKAIALTSAASGVQSSLPLYLLHKAYCQYRKELNQGSSFEDAATLDKVYSYLHHPATRSYPSAMPESDYFEYKGRHCIVERGTGEHARQTLDNYTEIQSVQSLIEEPEQNLFPQTQQALTYELVADTTGSDNRLTITTHSPYVLFALNNCMMGYLVKKNIPEEEWSQFPSYRSWINPEQVSIYEMLDNGTIKRLQDEDGILEDNYLNRAYKENSREYLSLLNYYEDEE